MNILRVVRIFGGLAVAAASFAPRVACAQVAPKLPARPTAVAPAPYTFPKVVTQVLPNGLRLAVIENHEIPMVAVRVALRGGAYLDAPGKEGSWALTLNSLREGTTTRSATMITDAAAELGTSFSSLSLSPVGAVPSFTTARSVWLPALDLVADMVVHPSFPADGFARAQANTATLVSRTSPVDIARKRLAAELFGADHAFARYPTDSSVKGLSRDEIVAFHSAYIRPQNTVIVISGDVTPDEARRAVENAFASWPPGGNTVDASVAPPKPRSTQTTIYLRDLPNAPQTQIVTGLLLPDRASSDAPAFEAADILLANGNISSRLSKAFRVDRGMAYTTGSAFIWRRAPQPTTWRAEFSVSPALSDTAVVEWLRLARDARDKRPVSADELAAAQTNLIGKLPFDLESIDAVAARVAQALQNDWPESFYTDYVRRVRALTQPEVQAAMTRHFDPDRLVLVVVGDRSKIESALRATGIPVVLIEK